MGGPRSQSAGLQGSCKSYALVGLDFGGLVICLGPKTPGLKRTTALWHTQLGGGGRIRTCEG